MLTADQKSFFAENGYLVVPEVVAPDLLDRLRRDFAGWVEDSRRHAAPYGETMDGRPRFDVEPGHSAARPALRRVASPIEVSEAYFEAMAQSRMVDAVADLIGPDVKLHHAKINSKLPGSATRVDWHQDFAFTPHSNDGLVTALLMVDEVTEENGPLEVLPGSHTGPIETLWHDGVFTGSVDAATAARCQARAVRCIGPAGSVCLMHTRLLHGSAPNRSDGPRTLFIVVYSAADAVPLAENPLPSRHEGLVVRGTGGRRARGTAFALDLPQKPRGASFFAQQGGARADSGPGGLTLRPLGQDFAAEVAGLDLRETLTEATVAAIEAAMDRFGVLVFRDQALDDATQLAFSRRFGPLEPAVNNISAETQRRIDREISDISNLDERNTLLAADDRRRMFNLGNMLWHSDSSFKATPARYSLLSGRVVPERGGDTQFADMRAAWDALDPDMQAELADRVAHHSLLYSRALLGFTDWTEAERRSFAPVRQRLVRRHPVTGRRSLFLASHIGAIEGMPVPEALALVRDLVEHATQPRFVYTHRWRAGDLVMWDNRVTMHRARRFDALHAVRDMRRTTVMDVASTLEQAA